MAYGRPGPLGKHHRCEGFDCGEPVLDEWLRRHGMAAQAAGSARVFVTTLDDGDEVVGHYALAAAQVEAADATARALKGQPATRPVPAILLARLAVDLGRQRAGVGQSLLQDVLLRCARAADAIGARVLLVHAKHGAARDWYVRFGFEPSPTDELHLMLLMKDVRALIERNPGT